VLSDGDLAALDQRRQMLRRRRGQLIFYQGQEPLGLYCVAEGDVLLERTDSHGHETAFRIAGPGEMIGYRSLFGRHAHEATARALSPVALCFFPAGVVEKFIVGNPALMREFLTLVARDPGPLYAPMLRNPMMPAGARLARLLLLLAQRRGQRTGSAEIAVRLPVSYGDMAALIGVRRETVTRRLHELERDGVCAHKGRELVITDIDRLAEVADEGLRPLDLDLDLDAGQGPSSSRNDQTP
jgi:CRP/FNR family transcriptional regulator